VHAPAPPPPPPGGVPRGGPPSGPPLPGAPGPAGPRGGGGGGGGGAPPPRGGAPAGGGAWARRPPPPPGGGGGGGGGRHRHFQHRHRPHSTSPPPRGRRAPWPDATVDRLESAHREPRREGGGEAQGRAPRSRDGGWSRRRWSTGTRRFVAEVVTPPSTVRLRNVTRPSVVGATTREHADPTDPRQTRLGERSLPQLTWGGPSNPACPADRGGGWRPARTNRQLPMDIAHRVESCCVDDL